MSTIQIQQRFRALPLALILTGALCQPVLAQDKPKGDGREFGPEANPGEVFKETKGRSAVKSQGLEVRELHGKAAGKPLSSMPGAKALARGRWAEMKDIPKTGLYLVDLDHVPPGLEEDLKSNGYRLDPDGTLTKNGEPVALFVHGETFQMKPEKKASSPGGQQDGALAKVTGWLSQLSSPLVSEAEAANPFPWACGSWYFRWEYHGGFCRDYHAWSHAYAWGPGSDGVCADPKPLTRIEYISTYAAVSGNTDWDYFYNADQSHSEAVWDIGCFWPAHVAGSGFHYAYWRDGAAWMYRTWTW